MSSQFPPASYNDIAKIAKKLGFSLYRQGKGSHEVWRRGDGRYTTLPNHGSKNIKRKTLKNILNDLQITPKDFVKLRKGK